MNGPDFAYPQTVEKNASAALDVAVSHGDWPTAIEATIQMVTAENLISHGNAVKGIAKIDSISALAPASWRAPLNLIKADIYSSIYNSIRWQADSRKLDADSVPVNPYEWSRDLFAEKVYGICKDVLEASAGEAQPIKDWAKFIDNASDAYALEMTLEEFEAKRCFDILNIFSEATRDIIPFFASGPEPVTPAQKCAALRNVAIEREITSAERRGQSLLLALALIDKANTLPASLKIKYLVEAYQKVAGSEGEQIILSEFSNYAYTDEDPILEGESPFPYSNREYLAILRKSVADFPNGQYANGLRNIIANITRPVAEVRYRNQYLSSSDIILDAKLTNCNESWALIYDYAPFLNSSDKHPKTREVAARCRLIKAVKLMSEGSVPFIAETTANAGRLPKGTYVVVPSATSDSKGIYPTVLNDNWREPFSVSDISVMTLQQPDAKTRVFVVDGANGRPIEGAQVKVYTRRDYSSPRKLINTLSTDKDGCVTVTEENFDIEALYEGSVWNRDSRFYNYSERRDTTIKNRLHILADRSLYHPGDSVKAVVIAYSVNGNEMAVREGVEFKAFIHDFNNNSNISQVTATTDRFGRAEVEFKLPEQGLLGTYQIMARAADSQYGRASIEVADYVAPTFFITSQHSDEDITPGDVVSLKGQVLTYSGMPVGGATVRYSVSYTPPMRWFSSGFATYDSSVIADAEGKYAIELPTANLKGTQFERGIFSVQLSATSPAGESQNGPTERFAIGKEFHTFPSEAFRKVEVADKVPALIFNVTDMLGRKVNKELSYEVIDKASDKVVAKGDFTSPSLELPEKPYPSAVYSVNVTLKDDPKVKADMTLTVWRRGDKCAPAGTNLWVPAGHIIARANENSVDVSVGSGVPDRWIPAILSSSAGKLLSMEWVHIEKDNQSLKVRAPQDNDMNILNLNWLSGLENEMCNVFILPAVSEEKLKVKTESFRDKVSAGDKERWSFRFFRKSSDASYIPAMAVMTDAALNAITPFDWSFTPAPILNGRPLTMRPSYNSWQHLNVSLAKTKYLSFSGLSMPMINDYGRGWGLGSYGRFFDDADRFYAVAETKAMYRKAGIQLTSAALVDDVKNEVMDMDVGVAVMEKAEAEEASLEEPMIRGMANAGGASVEEQTPELRETECPVAFFMPSLVSDKDGIVDIDFTVPNFNTTWAFQLLGYDSQLQTAKTTLEAVASKPIMVSTHAPRFVRTGDAIELTATVFNNSDAVCSPKCRFELVDLISGKTISAKNFASESIELTSNRILIMNWDVPSDVSAVGFRAYAETESHCDGEQALIPVLPASSPVVESTPFWIAPGGTSLDVKLPKFKSTDQVTLQYCDNPAWYCISALPDIVQPESKSVTSKMRALFGNSIAYHLISSRPNLRSGLETLLNDKDSEFAALKSNLEKDGNLKITQLSNTPWVNNAESETLRMSRLSSLLDDASAQKTIAEILEDVRSLQASNGGWSWCPDMEPSVWITSDVLRHFAMIVKAGADASLDDSKSMIKKAIKYVDSETVKDYRKYHKKGDSHSYFLDWLFVRSSFPTEYLSSGGSAAEMNSIATKAYKDIAKEWKEWGIGQKAKAAMVLWRSGDRRAASEILESLRQYASESPEKGMWFDNLNSGWGGMSTLQTTTLVLEAFSEIQPSNKIVDSLRQWLVLGRQYQDWGKNSYTVETVNAILSSGTDWTDPTDNADPEFTLKGKKIEVPESAKLTGAFTLTLSPKDASGKTLSITRSAASPAWGGVISQYEAPIMEVVPAEVPELSIRKSIVALVEGNDGQLIPKEGIELKKGMKVRVTLFINVGRDMDYVAVTDERSACLEPIDQLSGYRRSDGVGFYREVRDAQTNLFFGWMPKGQHVISYDCRVSQDGEFSCGIATAQSQYSPTTVAHSSGSILTVK